MRLHLLSRLPVRLTERVDEERGRVGSEMEVNRFFQCPDYRPMNLASLSEHFDMLFSMTNPLPRITSTELPMCTTTFRDDQRWIGKFTLPFSTLHNGVRVSQQCLVLSECGSNYMYILDCDSFL